MDPCPAPRFIKSVESSATRNLLSTKQAKIFNAFILDKAGNTPAIFPTLNGIVCSRGMAASPETAGLLFINIGLMLFQRTSKNIDFKKRDPGLVYNLVCKGLDQCFSVLKTLGYADFSPD